MQAAFVPVFSELLEQKRHRIAFRLAASMIFLVGLILGLLTALFILLAPLIMPIFVPGFSDHLQDLTIALSRILFPILILLGLTGMVVGVLNSYDRFGVFAISPFFWNVAIIAVLVGLAPAFPEGKQIYAYAIGVVVGTIVQLALPVWDLKHTPFGPGRALRSLFSFKDIGQLKNPQVRKVLVLMLPVTISLGLINFNLAINGAFGSLVSDNAPSAIDKAFRVYMLPQGIFSVAIATVLFPTLSRLAARGDYDELRSTMAQGSRQIMLMLVPAAAAILVLSEPMIRLIYQRGECGPGCTDQISEALFWFSFSLPFNGLFLLMTRTFFSLQRPWLPTAISGGNLVITALGAALLYKPFGVAGIVSATVIATVFSVIAQAYVLRGQLGRLELGRFLSTSVRLTIAAAALAAVSFGVWDALDHALGTSLPGQIISLGTGLAAGAVAYAISLILLRVPEARQVQRLIQARRGRE